MRLHHRSGKNVGKFHAIFSWITAAVVFIGSGVFTPIRADAAACAVQSTDYGKVTSSVTVPETATYRLWSHMKIAEATNNSYLLEIDGNTCFSVGGNGLQTGSWQWVAYRDSEPTSRTDIALTKGNHTIKLIGSKPNVKIDRLVLAADLSCTPKDDGTNCDVPQDVTPPTVDLTTPAIDSTVTGTVDLKATASDTVGVTKVEFTVNGGVISTSTTSPYTAKWDTGLVPNGLQTIGAKAYDAVGNSSQDSYKVTVQNGDKEAPTVPGNVTATPAAYNKVAISWSASTDNNGVKGYTIIRDGVPLGNATPPNYLDTSVFSNTTYSYQVLAFDAVGNKSAASAKVSVKTPATPDTQAPTTPQGVSAAPSGPNQVNLSWSASTDNIGVVAYDIYRGDTKVASVQQGTSFGDGNLAPNTSYSYTIKARDANGNTSPASQAVSAKTAAVVVEQSKNLSISGTVRDGRTKRSIPYALILIKDGKRQTYYVANRHGQYKIRHLKTNDYKLTYRAFNYRYKVLSITVPLTNSSVVKDVSLEKR